MVTSELTWVEFASVVSAAGRAKRIGAPKPMLDLFDVDCGADGPITLLRLDSATVLPMARQLVTWYAARMLGAVHLAVAATDAMAVAAGEPVVLVTRDGQQAMVATEHGLSVL